MTKWIIAAVLVGSLLCGCARNYVITLNNGTRLGTSGKPRLEGGYYVYKDALGRQARLSASRVIEIAPTSMAGQSEPTFKSVPAR